MTSASLLAGPPERGLLAALEVRQHLATGTCATPYEGVEMKSLLDAVASAVSGAPLTLWWRDNVTAPVDLLQRAIADAQRSRGTQHVLPGHIRRMGVEEAERAAAAARMQAHRETATQLRPENAA